MNADDTFRTNPSNPRPQRRRTNTLSSFMRDMQAQVESNTRAMRRFSAQLLHELARRSSPSLSSQAWQTAAQAVAQAQTHTPSDTQLTPQVMHSQLSPHQALPTVRSIRWVETSHDQAMPLIHLRLSGRFSDVCAELDRLAAQEARS